VGLLELWWLLLSDACVEVAYLGREGGGDRLLLGPQLEIRVFVYVGLAAVVSKLAKGLGWKLVGTEGMVVRVGVGLVLVFELGWGLRGCGCI